MGGRITKQAMVIRLSDLEDNSVQPPWRTADTKKLKRLAAHIRSNGLNDPPTVARIDGHFVVINGHRRIAACRMNGETQIPCRVISGHTVQDAERLFEELDGVTETLGGAERLFGYAFSEDREAFLRTLKSHHANTLLAFERCFGTDRMVELAKSRTNPGIIIGVRRACRFLERKLQISPDQTKVADWVVKHRASALIRTLEMYGKKAEARKLLRCVETDSPYRIRK